MVAEGPRPPAPVFTNADNRSPRLTGRARGSNAIIPFGGLMILAIQEKLSASVRAAVEAAFDVPLPAVTFQYPPRAELGDLALTAPFDLAKTLRRKPREIAERLAGDLAGAGGVRKAEVAGGGYVNVFLRRGAVFARSCTTGCGRGAGPARRRARVIVEHTSINPNKAAHIGHLRNAVLGDTFVRVLRERGREVGRPELHRRHRRAGGGRGGRASCTWRRRRSTRCGR